MKKLIGGLASLVGIGLSLYLVQHHYEIVGGTQSSSWCNINELLNCDRVNSSKFSTILGFPLGIWGALYFLSCLLMFWWPKGGLKGLALPLTLSGIVVSLALAGISRFSVGAFCLNCAFIYLITFINAFCAYPWGKIEINPKALMGPAAVLGIAVFMTYFWNDNLATKSGADEQIFPEEIIRLYEASPKFDLPARSRLSFPENISNAPVVIQEFADFECPHCATVSPILKNLALEYKGSIQLIFRHYPLSSFCNKQVPSTGHENSCQAALLANCSGDKFWDVAMDIFKNSATLSPHALQEIRNKHGITADQQSACEQNSSSQYQQIIEDIDDAKIFSLQGTPSVLINGRLYHSGFSPQKLRVIVEHLGAKRP